MQDFLEKINTSTKPFTDKAQEHSRYPRVLLYDGKTCHGRSCQYAMMEALTLDNTPCKNGFERIYFKERGSLFTIEGTGMHALMRLLNQEAINEVVTGESIIRQHYTIVPHNITFKPVTT